MKNELSKPAEAIDVHAHAFPPAFMAALRKKVSRPLDIRAKWEWDGGRFLSEMDRCGIAVQVLSLAHVYEYYGAEERALAAGLCRTANDEFAAISARLPGRFKRFAVVPLPDIDAACEELERTRVLEGFCGITLSTHLHERTLDDSGFIPFFEHANRLGLVIFLHPLQRPFPKQWYGYRLEHLIGLPVDTTFALARLALSGFFDHYPNIKIIGAHVGGAIPFLAPRIERAFREGKSRHKPSHYFANILRHFRTDS